MPAGDELVGTAPQRLVVEGREVVGENRAIGNERAEHVGRVRALARCAGDAVERRALQLRGDVSAYDAAYVVLAEALDCPLLTRDIRLTESSGHLVRIEVR